RPRQVPVRIDTPHGLWRSHRDSAVFSRRSSSNGRAGPVVKETDVAQLKVALVAHEGVTVPESMPVELARHGIDFVAHECRTRAELAQHAGDADVVWVFGGSRILTAETLAAIPRCGAIIRTGSGTDNVPVTAATARGIVVANTPEAVSEAVAEHAIGL